MSSLGARGRVGFVPAGAAGVSLAWTGAWGRATWGPMSTHGSSRIHGDLRRSGCVGGLWAAGALAGYALGRSGTPAVRRFVGQAELARAERLVQRFGSAVLVVCRGVPVLAEASVVVAGTARVRFATFAAAVLTPFVLGIGVPAGAIWVARRLERRAS